jgi:hypothetical protein
MKCDSQRTGLSHGYRGYYWWWYCWREQTIVRCRQMKETDLKNSLWPTDHTRTNCHCTIHWRPGVGHVSWRCLLQIWVQVSISLSGIVVSSGVPTQHSAVGSPPHLPSHDSDVSLITIWPNYAGRWPNLLTEWPPPSSSQTSTIMGVGGGGYFLRLCLPSTECQYWINCIWNCILIFIPASAAFVSLQQARRRIPIAKLQDMFPHSLQTSYAASYGLAKVA